MSVAATINRYSALGMRVMPWSYVRRRSAAMLGRSDRFSRRVASSLLAQRVSRGGAETRSTAFRVENFPPAHRLSPSTTPKVFIWLRRTDLCAESSSPRPPRLRVTCSSQEQQQFTRRRGERGGGRRDISAGPSNILKSWMERDDRPEHGARPGRLFLGVLNVPASPAPLCLGVKHVCCARRGSRYAVRVLHIMPV